MTGSSVFDYVHTADHAELAEQLGLTLASTSQSGQGQSSSQGMNHHHLHSPPSPASATGSVDDGNSSMNPDGKSEEDDDPGRVLMVGFRLLNCSDVVNESGEQCGLQRTGQVFLHPHEIDADQTRLSLQIFRISGKFSFIVISE